MVQATPKRTTPKRAATTKTSSRKPAAASPTKAKAKASAAKQTTGKTVASKPTVKSPAPSQSRATPKSTPPAGTVSIARQLKKKELIDRVATASGLKKAQARAAIEATFAVLGEALEKGEAMSLEPLGKVKVQKQKDAGAANVYFCRVRRKKDAPIDRKPPLAKAAE